MVSFTNPLGKRKKGVGEDGGGPTFEGGMIDEPARTMGEERDPVPTAGDITPEQRTENAEQAEDLDEQVDQDGGVDAGIEDVPDDDLLNNYGGDDDGDGVADNAQGEDTRDFEGLAEDYLEQELRAGLGSVDTSEEEALIREMQGGALGANILDARARMGAAGFGESGGLFALEGDLQDQFGRNAARDIFDVREREERQQDEQARAALGLDIDMRDAAAEEAFRQSQLNIAEAILAGIEDGGGGGQSTVDNPFGDDFTFDDDERAANEAAGEAARAQSSAPVVEAPPAGAEKIDEDGSFTYYVDENGNYYRVAKPFGGDQGQSGGAPVGGG